MPQSDGHYKEFKEVYGTETTSATDRCCRKDSIMRKVCAFLLLCNMQRITILSCNVGSVVCGALYILKIQVSNSELDIIQSILDNYSYTCGSSMADLNLCGRLCTVCISLWKFTTTLSAMSFCVFTVVKQKFDY